MSSLGALAAPGSDARLVRLTLLAAVCLLLWDTSGGDAWLARTMGGAQHFPLRDAFWTNDVLHHHSFRRSLLERAMIDLELRMSEVEWGLE